LRPRAERHRQVARGFVATDDARMAHDEAHAVECEADRLEAELTELQGGTVVVFSSNARR
jgi:hypothetical protein